MTDPATKPVPVAAEPVPLETEIEVLAAAWVRPYDQVEHLMRARDWLVHLDPHAALEVRLAAMTHDIERLFPGGPKLDHATTSWDSPFYLYPHSLRSAESVGVWLFGVGPAGAIVDHTEVRRLVALHEVGGLRGADELQAADSLSFLETLAGLTRQWVLTGVCSKAKAVEKLQYMADRIRIEPARQPARALLEWALLQLDDLGTQT
jgi:hypothetical protein